MQQPGASIIDDKYEILSPIGEGGMGLVYKAYQRQLDRLVAIKMLNMRLAEEDSLQRFEREAIALSSVQHRNIVSFYGYGVHNDEPYLVTEFLEGCSLEAHVRAKGPLDLNECLRICGQICEALHCAHANDVVHRDLKPSNIMLVQSGGETCVKLIDFGLVRIMPSSGKSAQQLTEIGQTVGSVSFMSPEQCVAGPADPRTDIYSLGCLMHYCLTGTPPFVGDQSVMVMMQHVNAPTPRLQDVCPATEFPAAIENIILKATEKRPGDRYQTAREMEREIISLRADVSSGSTPNVAAIARSSLDTTNGASSTTLKTSANKQGYLKSRKTGLTIAAAGLTLLGIGIIAYLPRMGVEPAPEKSTYVFHQASGEQCFSLTKERQKAVCDSFERALKLNESDHLLAPSEQLLAIEGIARRHCDDRKEQEFLHDLNESLNLHAKYNLPFTEPSLYLISSAPLALIELGAPDRKAWAVRLHGIINHVCAGGRPHDFVELAAAPLISLYLSVNDLKSAEQISAMLPEHSAAPVTIINRARLAIRQGQLVKAKGLSEIVHHYKARGDWPANGAALLSLISAAEGKINQSEKYYQEMISAFKNIADPYQSAMFLVLQNCTKKDFALAHAEFLSLEPNITAGNYFYKGYDIYLRAYLSLLEQSDRATDAKEVEKFIQKIESELAAMKTS